MNKCIFLVLPLKENNLWPELSSPPCFSPHLYSTSLPVGVTPKTSVWRCSVSSTVTCHCQLSGHTRYCSTCYTKCTRYKLCTRYKRCTRYFTTRYTRYTRYCTTRLTRYTINCTPGTPDTPGTAPPGPPAGHLHRVVLTTISSGAWGVQEVLLWPGASGLSQVSSSLCTQISLQHTKGKSLKRNAGNASWNI